jgi:hypothetical protein
MHKMVAAGLVDGDTFLRGTVGTQAQNQTLYRKPAYDSTRDFASVGLFLEAPLVIETIKTPSVREKLSAVGLKLVSEDRATPAYLDQFVKGEIAKWAVLIKASGISMD